MNMNKKYPRLMLSLTILLVIPIQSFAATPKETVPSADILRPPSLALYRAGTDFIRRYIFPGGFLPSPEGSSDRSRRAGSLERGTT